MNERQQTWGSYKLRCSDFKFWAEKYTNGTVMVDTIHYSQAIGVYDATILIKFSKLKTKQIENSAMGRIFVDVIDAYYLKAKEVPKYMEVIGQAVAQTELFRTHKTHVVSHWYNSYLGDDNPDVPLEPLPTIVPTDGRKLRVGTIWNPQKHEKGCLEIRRRDVSYECIEEEFGIKDWYLKYVHAKQSLDDMQAILDDPLEGEGMLYQNLFRQYDFLVLYPKANEEKLRFGNVQRVVSQMRSGTPVLVEARGPVFEDFVKLYDYKCAFQRVQTFTGVADGKDRRKFPDYRSAISMMMDPNVRQECRDHALEITKDFSPFAISGKLLRTLGYKGNVERQGANGDMIQWRSSPPFPNHHLNLTRKDFNGNFCFVTSLFWEEGTIPDTPPELDFDHDATNGLFRFIYYTNHGNHIFPNRYNASLIFPCPLTMQYNLRGRFGDSSVT